MLALFDSPDTFLVRYHRHHTGITSWALSRGRARGDLSSYDLLAELVPSQTPHKVVDLGCGDGYLIERLLARGVPTERIVGIDISPDELMLARKRSGLDYVAMLCERADRTTLPNDSTGYVLSHMSFMVLSKIEDVVAEIARILIPGGVFSVVVPSEAEPDGAAAAFFELFNEIYHSQATRAPVLGDPRTWTEAGLRGLLRYESQFDGLEFTHIDLCLDGTVTEVWNSLSARYEAYVILPQHRAQLRDRFMERARQLARSDGTIPCTLPLCQLVCRRANAKN